MSKKSEIIALSLAEPALGVQAIAQRIGCCHTWVEVVRTQNGLVTDRKVVTRKIIEVSEANPTWGCRRIARIVGCSDRHVRRIRREQGLTLQVNHVASVSVPAAERLLTESNSERAGTNPALR